MLSPESRQISSRVFFQDFSTYLEDIVMAPGIFLSPVYTTTFLARYPFKFVSGA